MDHEKVAEKICNEYWAKWKECIKYTDKLKERIVVALAQAYQDGEKRGRAEALNESKQIAFDTVKDYEWMRSEDRGEFENFELCCTSIGIKIRSLADRHTEKKWVGK